MNNIDDEDSKYIDPPTSLRDKVKTTGPNVINLETLERADQVLADMSDDYLEWVNLDLVRLQYVFEDLIKGKEDRQGVLEQIFSISHDMKGQGGTFGFDLVTFVGNHLCRLIDRIDDTISVELQNEAVRIHINALRLIVSTELKGDGGEQGKLILSGIEIMEKKLTPVKN